MANEMPQSKGRMVELFFIYKWMEWREVVVHDGGNIIIIGTQQCEGDGGWRSIETEKVPP